MYCDILIVKIFKNQFIYNKDKVKLKYRFLNRFEIFNMTLYCLINGALLRMPKLLFI